MDDVMPRKSQPRQVWWALVFGLNLIVSLFFGWMVTAEGGRIGMAAGVALLWYLGHRLCAISDPFGRALVAGGFVVALTQLFPIAHIFVGIVSVGIAQSLLHEPDSGSSIHSPIAGLIATGSMGVIMMTVAACLGAIGSLMFARRRSAVPAQVPGLYDRQLDA
jgi:hypothetical protein